MQLFKRAAYISAIAVLFPLFFADASTVIHVPFTSQAPFGNWARPWQDFCEEASLVMAAHFVLRLPLTPQAAAAEMQIIKRYEELVFGRSKDTSIEETAGILRGLFGFKNVSTKVIASGEDIKKELAAGRLVIMPAAGRMLKNPYFTAPGPLYHMLVIRGFDDARNVFITNDPGTRRGEGFAYNQKVLFAALHDWNGGKVLEGQKRIMVVGK